MAKFHNPKYSKKEVSQKFNLKEILGYSPSDEQKELFYELAAEFQQSRTTSGKDINGNQFKNYSKKYAEAKGVTTDSVDLLDTGKMLSSYESANESSRQKNMLKIKMEDGKETLKSYNHNVGDTLPKRTFFGIVNNKEIESIRQQVDTIKKTTDRAPIIKKPKQDESNNNNSTTPNLAELRAAVDELEIDFNFNDYEYGGFDGDS